MLAPGTLAPVLSVTVPTSVAVPVVWAKAIATSKRRPRIDLHMEASPLHSRLHRYENGVLGGGYAKRAPRSSGNAAGVMRPGCGVRSLMSVVQAPACNETGVHPDRSGGSAG